MKSDSNNNSLQSFLFSIIRDEWWSLGDELLKRIGDCELPLACEIYQQHQALNGSLLVGINGPQGSGKSTTAGCLQIILQQYFGLRVAVISIDDFYLTKAERSQLAGAIHPLLNTRGVPGTHDIKLALDTLGALKLGVSNGHITVPRFNKAIDDRYPTSAWQNITTPVDVVLFEGWCVGATAESCEALQTPMNELESHNDKEGRWRTFVNQALSFGYKELFDLIDFLVVFKCHDFSWISQWRKQQEKANAKAAIDAGGSTSSIMSDAEVDRFILHYERVTRHCQQTLPEFANLVVSLDQQRNVCAMDWRLPY